MLEEFFYIPGKTFLEIIAPILALSVVALIAISTLGSQPGSYQYALLESGFFDKEFVTYVCKACEEKGIENECKHNLDKIPHWSDEDRLSIIKNAMGENKEKFARESLGIVRHEPSYVFDQGKIRDMYNRERYELSDYVNYIFISVDPVGGSDNPDKNKSDFVIMSICEPYTTILGMEQLNIVATVGYEKILIDHLHRLRLNQYTANATLVIDVESGSGFVAPDVAAMVRNNFRNYYILSDFKVRKEGTLTTNEGKAKMYQLTHNELRQDRVRIATNIVTHNPDPEKMVAEFRDQMLNYSRYAIKAKTAFETTKYVYTGKGEDGNSKDDLSLTFQRAIYTRFRFQFDPKFAHFRR